MKVLRSARLFAAFFPFLVLSGNLEANSPSSVTAKLRDVARFNGSLFAVGHSGTILRSNADGVWESIDAGASGEMWDGIAAGDGKLVAVARSGAIAVSEDGGNWQHLPDTNGPSLSRVIRASGEFWAIGNEGRLIRSADGLLWDSVSTGVDKNLWGIVHGNGLFVIVGDEGTILTSADGEAWTSEPADSSWDIRDIAFGSEGFVAIARGGIVLRSAEGVSWSRLSDCLRTGLLSAAAFGNGRYVVAAGTGDDLVAYVSEDGENWQPRVLPLPTYVSRLIFDGERFVAAGYYGSVFTSADGEDWDVLLTGLEFGLWGIADRGSGDLVAVGEAGRIQVLATNGNWETKSPRRLDWLWDVAHGNGWTVAVGERGIILRSANGSDWETVKSPEPDSCLAINGGDEEEYTVPDPRLGGIAFGRGMFVAVGGEGTVLTSADGETWVQGEFPVPAMFWSIAYGAGTFVAVGEDGAAAVSQDGVSWEALSFDETRSLHSVAFYEGRGFSIAGADGFRAYSTDGTAWEFAPASANASWEGVAGGTGWFAAVGDDGAVAISADGRDWAGLHPGDGQPLHDLVIGPWGATVVGAAESIHTFPLPPVEVEHSGDIAVDTNGDATLSVVSGGTGPFTYQWFHDNESLAGEDEPVLQLTGVGRDAIGEYRLLMMNEAGTAESTPLFVTVRTRYEEWAAKHFPDPASPRADPSAESTGRGVPNLLAYAFDSDPGSVRNHMPVAGIETAAVGNDEADYPTLTFARAIGAADIVYIPEVSSDLSHWTPIDPQNTIHRWREGSREFVTVRDNIAVGQGDRARFLRLRVEVAE